MIIQENSFSQEVSLSTIDSTDFLLYTRTKIPSLFDKLDPKNLLLRKKNNLEQKETLVLIGEIILGNAHGTGVVCGVKQSQVDKSEDEGELLKVKVYEHKTGKAKSTVIFFEREVGSAFKHSKYRILPQTHNSGSVNQDEEYLCVHEWKEDNTSCSEHLNFLLKDKGGKQSGSHQQNLG